MMRSTIFDNIDLLSNYVEKLFSRKLNDTIGITIIRKYNEEIGFNFLAIKISIDQHRIYSPFIYIYNLLYIKIKILKIKL